MSPGLVQVRGSLTVTLYYCITQSYLKSFLSHQTMKHGPIATDWKHLDLHLKSQFSDNRDSSPLEDWNSPWRGFPCDSVTQRGLGFKQAHSAHMLPCVLKVSRETQHNWALKFRSDLIFFLCMSSSSYAIGASSPGERSLPSSLAFSSSISTIKSLPFSCLNWSHINNFVHHFFNLKFLYFSSRYNRLGNF